MKAEDIKDISSLSSLFDALDKADWYFGYSDDPRAFKAGKEQCDSLKNLVNEIKDPQAKEIATRYYDIVSQVPAKPGNDEKLAKIRHEVELKLSGEKEMEPISLQPVQPQVRKAVPAEVDSLLTIVENPNRGYRDRTISNASNSDITIAFATNFDTPGEKLTKKAAGENYVAIKANDTNIDAQVGAVRAKLVQLGKLTDPVRINIAGNSANTLDHSIGQQLADRQVDAVIRGLLESGVCIRQMRSGGQTGFDEAGAKAALANNIPAVIEMPLGYLRRDSEGKDMEHRPSELKQIFSSTIQTLEMDCRKEFLEANVPFRVAASYLPSPLDNTAIYERTPAPELGFTNSANAVAFIKAAYANAAGGLTKEEYASNMEVMKQLSDSPVAISADIRMSETSARDFAIIENDVTRSVLLDQISTNGKLMSKLLSTGLSPLATNDEQLGAVLCDVRAATRRSVQNQQEGGYVVVTSHSRNPETGAIEDSMNMIRSTGETFSSEWFQDIRRKDGLAYVKTFDGLSDKLKENWTQQQVDSYIKQSRDLEERRTQAPTVSHRR